MTLKTTLQEANTYISNMYLKTDDKYIKWNELEDDDKQIMLNKAELVINNQTLILPAGLTETPADIKAAITEEALYILTVDLSLITTGIKSESIDGVSVSYDLDRITILGDTSKNLLRRYLYGYYKIL